MLIQVHGYRVRGLLGSFRGSMSQRRTRTLRADGMHQITVASLFGKRQGCFQTIPLQHFAEFSLSEHNEPWARYFYESNTDLDGLLDPNAHNAADAVALFERAEDALLPENDLPLTDPRLRLRLLAAAEALHLTFID